MKTLCNGHIQHQNLDNVKSQSLPGSGGQNLTLVTDCKLMSREK